MEHSFKKCCIAKALGSTQVETAWRNKDTDDTDAMMKLHSFCLSTITH